MEEPAIPAVDAGSNCPWACDAGCEVWMARFNDWITSRRATSPWCAFLLCFFRVKKGQMGQALRVLEAQDGARLVVLIHGGRKTAVDGVVGQRVVKATYLN